MADHMFAQPDVHVGGKRKYTVLVSIVTHTIIIAAAVIVPVIATDTLVLPRRFDVISFEVRPPLPPSPPAPRRAAQEQLTVIQPAVPLVAPSGIVAESPIKSTEPFDGLKYSEGLVPGDDNPPPPPSLPPPPAPTEAPLPVGGDIKRPMKVRDMAPQYPAIARTARVQGLVIIEATIGPDGKVQDARILRSNPLLDEAALDAVRQWEYTPTLLNGRPIAIVMTVTVDFRLR